MEEHKEVPITEIKQIENEWKSFSQTLAFERLMEYVQLQDELTIIAAKGPVMIFNDDNGQEVTFDAKKAAFLLQRSAGYDIVKMYINGFVKP